MFNRISKHLSSTWLRPYSRRVDLKLCTTNFSTQKEIQDIKSLRETAKLSSRVIKMIENPFQQSQLEKEAWGNEIKKKNVMSYALSERIKKALININADPLSRKEILKHFTSGVKLPSEIFKQIRIIDAQTQSRFVYCPNSIITRQIFSIMSEKPPLKFQEKRILLKGYKGISKTISASLSWKLNRYIDQYRMAFQGDKQMLKKEFKQPKIVYWSIEWEVSLIRIFQNIFDQLSELKSFYTFKQFLDNQIDIEEFYLDNYGIKVKLFIDQINLLAKLWKQLQSDEKSGISVKPQRKDQIQNLIRLVRTISKQFSKTVYLSSMDIELDFLKKCDLGTDGWNTIVPIKEVQYSSLMYSHESLIEICHFFIFWFNEEKFKKEGIQVSEEDLRQAQQKCIHYFRQKLKNREYFVTTLFKIYEQSKQKQLLKFQVSSMKPQDYMFKRFQSFIKKTTESTRQQFLRSFFKGDESNFSRQVLALRLSQQVRQKIQLEKSIQLSTNELSSLSTYIIPFKELNLNRQSATRLLPNAFFSFDNSEELVALRLPASFTYQILEPKISDWIKDYLNDKNDWMKKTSNAKVLAGTIEGLFIIALKKGDTNFKIKVNKFEDKKLSKQELKYFNIKEGSFPFAPLQPGVIGLSFLDRVTNPLQKMIQDQVQCAVLEPVLGKFNDLKVKNVQKYQVNEVSKVIDLMLAKVFYGTDQNINEIEILIIDVTISQESKQKISDKMFTFLKTFLDFSDKNAKFINLKRGNKTLTIPIKVKYYIYCLTKQYQQLFTNLKQSRQFKPKLHFEGAKEANAYQVSLQGKKKSLLLTEVGFIDMSQDITFEKGQNNKDVLSFKEALKVLKYFKDKKNQ